MNVNRIHTPITGIRRLKEGKYRPFLSSKRKGLESNRISRANRIKFASQRKRAEVLAFCG